MILDQRGLRRSADAVLSLGPLVAYWEFGAQLRREAVRNVDGLVRSGRLFNLYPSSHLLRIASCTGLVACCGCFLVREQFYPTTPGDGRGKVKWHPTAPRLVKAWRLPTWIGGSDEVLVAGLGVAHCFHSILPCVRPHWMQIE